MYIDNVFSTPMGMFQIKKIT